MKKYGYLLLATVLLTQPIISRAADLDNTEIIDKSTKNDDSKQVKKIYHDYDEYQKALAQYQKDLTQYQSDLSDYNNAKDDYDKISDEISRIEKENSEKKKKYEDALAQYQKDLNDYNKKQDEINKHTALGQYTGPEIYTTYTHLQTYLVNYAAMTEMLNSGASLNGTNLQTKLHNNLLADPYSNSADTRENIKDIVDQWNIFHAFEQSIYGKSLPMGVDNVEKGAMNNDYYKSFNGVEFYHTFNSTTGATLDNIPKELDHPTENNINTALTNLFSQTGGQPFDAATQQMTENTFMINQTMVSNWQSALQEAKTQSLTLLEDSVQQYKIAFQNYNNSNYETADYNTFMAELKAAGAKEVTAVNLIGGFPNVSLEDDDDSAPFYNDLKTLSPSELANKYGYLTLLVNMAHEATYGYFHLLTPSSNEVITVYTASTWQNQFQTFGGSKGDYTPNLTPPTEPTPPSYDVVPALPDEPIKPTPPEKPIYEESTEPTPPEKPIYEESTEPTPPEKPIYEESTEPTPPSKSRTPNQSNKIPDNNKESLPQTGEDKTLKHTLTTLGVLIIGLGGLLTYRFKLKK